MIVMNLSELKAQLKGMEKTIKSVTKIPLQKNAHFKINLDTLIIYTWNGVVVQFCKLKAEIEDIAIDNGFSIPYKKFAQMVKAAAADKQSDRYAGHK